MTPPSSTLRHVLAAGAGALLAALPVRAPLGAQAAADSTPPGWPLPRPAAWADEAWSGGAAVTVIDRRDVDLAAVRTLSDLLSSRVPGVLVQSSGGTVGAGSRVRMRGVSTPVGSGEPLLVIDGVRAASAQNTLVIGVGGQQPSRLDDVNLEDVDRVEVLRGPAAGALYGAGAEYGVIVVTTKRGEPGKLRGHLAGEGSVATQDAGRFPANFARRDQSSTTEVRGCPLQEAAAGACVPGPLLSLAPLEVVSPFRTAVQNRVAGNVSGGARGATFYAAGGLAERNGVYDQNAQRRGDLRLNVGARLPAGVSLATSLGYLRSETMLPYNDSADGVLNAALFGSALSDSTSGYSVAARRVAGHETQDVSRRTGGARLDWQSLSWLRAYGAFGVDDVRADELAPPAPAPWWNGGEGVRLVETGSSRERRSTLSYGASARYPLGRTLRAVTSLGAERVRLRAGWRHEAGDPASGLAASESVGARSWPEGMFVEQRLVWRDRVELTGAARRQKLTDVPITAVDPAVSAVWRIGDEPFWPRARWLGPARLRAAVGRVSAAPIVDMLVIYPTGSEPPPPGPSRTRELEVGLDVPLLGGRLAVELTGYDKTSAEPRLPPADWGFPVRAPRTARTTNRGFEGTLRGRLASRDALRWDATLSATVNRNRLGSLPWGPILPSGGFGVQRTTPGEPLGAYIGFPIRGYADRNGDGIISSAGCPGPECEVTLGDREVYLGSPFPTREISLGSRATIRRAVTVAALLDYRGGMHLLNMTEASRCFMAACRDVNDPRTPLAEQAKAAAARRGFFAGYVEDASFLKLREISASLHAPAAWASSLGAAALSLTLAGRNLATLTRYSGADPEVNAGGQAALGTADYATQPPVRSFVLRLDVTR